MLTRVFLFLMLCFGPASAIAGEIMFEGFYRMEANHKHNGYAIMRYEFDAKTNSFIAYSFLRAKFGDKVLEESLKARADDKFHPLEYQYTSHMDKELKSIDATFKGETMTLKISDGKSNKIKVETYKNPKGTILSTFLPYLLLQQKLKPGIAFKYSAVAEEDGGSYWGKAWLKSKETEGKTEVYTIANDFKNEAFTSRMAVIQDPQNHDKNIKGEVLSTNSPDKSLSTRLVAAASEATEGQPVPNKTLLSLFGTLPTGKLNLVATADTTPGKTKMVEAEDSALIPIDPPAQKPSGP